MSYNEAEHPRDEIGRWVEKSAKNGEKSSEDSKNLAEELFRDSRIQKEIETRQLKIKNELLDALGAHATTADILYGNEKSLKKKVEDLKSGKLPQSESGSNSSGKEIFTRPVQGKIISNFGPRNVSIGSKNHMGVDFRAPIGTPVKTIAGGKVTVAQSGIKGYGTAVYIDHGMISGKRVVSIYGHLSKCDVKVGDKVKPGQVVAKSGNTGISEGPHLHLTIMENGKAVNPKKYLE